MKTFDEFFGQARGQALVYVNYILSPMFQVIVLMGKKNHFVKLGFTEKSLV